MNLESFQKTEEHNIFIGFIEIINKHSIVCLFLLFLFFNQNNPISKQVI